MIDIRTLLLVSTIILVCRAALLVYAWVINPTYLAIRFWAIGSALMALGALFLSLREMVPLTVSVLLGQTAVIVGWLFTSAGTIRAADGAPPWRWGASVAAAALTATACFLLIWPDYGLRTIAVSLPGLLFDSYVVFTCLRSGRDGWRGTTLRILAFVLSISILSSLLKNYYILQSGSSSLLDHSPMISQYFMLSIITMVACTVLYLLLDAQKIQEELADEIKERKRAESALSQFKAIIESTDDAIISKSLQGIITSWNPGAERLFGYTAAEALGTRGLMLIPDERQGEEQKILARIKLGERVEHFESVRRRKDGQLVDISATISPITDGDGKVVGASKIARDITERKRQEDLIKGHNALLTRQKVELEATLGRIKRLEGLLSICMQCKKIRTDNNDWHQLERYITENSDAVFSHGICPECLDRQMKKLD